MAYTKTPQYNTQQTIRVPVQGSMVPSFAYTNIFKPNSNYINCYPISLKQWHKDPINVLIKREGLAGDSNFWTGDPRGFGIASQINLGLSVAYAATSSGNMYNDAGQSKALHYTSGYVGFCEYRVGTTYYVVILENHATAAYLHLFDPAANTIASTSLGVGAQGDPVFMDGYIFVCGAVGNQRIYNSTIGAPGTFSTSTDFIDCEMFADNLTYISKHKNHIVGFGISSIEFFYNNANQLGSPLTRNTSYAVRAGLGVGGLSGYTDPLIQSIGDSLFFIGQFVGAPRGVLELTDFQVKDISTPQIQQAITQCNEFRLQVGQERTSPTLILSLADVVDTYNYMYNVVENLWVENQYFQNDATRVRVMFSGTRNGKSKYVLHKIVSGVGAYSYASNSIYELGGTEDLIAIYTTDIIDFGVNNSKHMMNVELLGTFYGQNVKLEYTKDNTDSDDVTWTDMGTINTTTASPWTPYRWRELGWGNHWRFKFTFGISDGAVSETRQQITMRGFECSFDQHTD